MIETTIIENGSPRQTLEGLPDAVEEALTSVVEYWHHNMLPGHFTEAGGQKYGYQPRKGQDEPSMLYKRDVDKGISLAKLTRSNRLVKNPHYYWTKWRWKGTHDPLVFTGDTKLMALRSIKVVRKTVKSSGMSTATGVMALPGYFYKIGKRNDRPQPDKVNELTRTMPDEQAELEEVMRREMDVRIHSIHSPPVSTTF